MHTVQIKNGRWHLQLRNAPEFCHSLPSAPRAKEEKLNEGVWLILVFAVWSGPDRQAIDIALSAVETFSGKIQLGIRPMDEYGETAVWCPEAKNIQKTPLWLVFRDGALIDEFGAMVTKAELTSRIKPAVDEMHRFAGGGCLPDLAGECMDARSESHT